MSHDPQPLGGKIISKPVMIFGPLIVICMLLIVKRLVFGLGSVSDLNGGFPWGVWIAFDLLIGTGFACGGWALAWAVYVFNRGQYHPLVRPALLALPPEEAFSPLWARKTPALHRKPFEAVAAPSPGPVPVWGRGGCRAARTGHCGW